MAKDPNAPPANPLTILEVTAIVFRHWTDANITQKAVAVAVCAAETGGTFDASSSLVNTFAMGARGPSIGSIDRGLWEINSYWHKEVSDAEAYDPERNAYHAHRIWNASGNTFSTQWATAWPGGRRNGTGPRPYEKYMEEATDAVLMYNAGGVVGAERAPGDLQSVSGSPGSVLYAGQLYTPDVEYHPKPDLNSTTLVLPNGRLLSLAIESGTGRIPAIDAMVVGVPELDLSMSECSQFTITFDDPELRLVKQRNIFLGSLIVYGGLIFAVENFAVGGEVGPPQVTLTARTHAIHKLKGQRGAKVVSNQSPTEYAFAAAKSVGLNFVGQTSYRRVQIARGEKKPGTNELGESEWEVLQRLAAELGFICFESYGTLYFAKPSWLAFDRKYHTFTHKVVWPTPTKYLAPDLAKRFLTALKVPAITASVNDRLKDVRTGSVTLRWESGSAVRPGEKMTLEGLPGFDGFYLIDHVQIPLDGHSQIAVGVTVPVDPEPSLKEEFHLPEDDYTEVGEYGNEGGGNAAAQQAHDSSSKEMFWPAGGRVTSEFGEPNHGSPPHIHKGIDIAPYVPGTMGVQVRAAAGGVIIHRGPLGGLGTAVVIDHGMRDGVRRITRYGHLAALRIKNAAGNVATGEIIGIMGSTGAAQGIHLHFEVREDDVAQDPRKYLVDPQSPPRNGGMQPNDWTD